MLARKANDAITFAAGSGASSASAINSGTSLRSSDRRGVTIASRQIGSSNGDLGATVQDNTRSRAATAQSHRRVVDPMRAGLANRSGLKGDVTSDPAHARGVRVGVLRRVGLLAGDHVLDRADRGTMLVAVGVHEAHAVHLERSEVDQREGDGLGARVEPDATELHSTHVGDVHQRTTSGLDTVRVNRVGSRQSQPPGTSTMPDMVHEHRISQPVDVNVEADLLAACGTAVNTRRDQLTGSSLRARLEDLLVVGAHAVEHEPSDLQQVHVTPFWFARSITSPRSTRHSRPLPPVAQPSSVDQVEDVSHFAAKKLPRPPRS